MQRRHGQASKASPVLPAVHEVARVRRPHQFDIDAVDGMARLAGYQWDPSDDLDVDSQRVEFTRPREVPGFASTPHHRQTPHQHRHAHRRSRVS
jgi:hypothetical protein